MPSASPPWKPEKKFFVFLVTLAIVSWGLWIGRGFVQISSLASITKSDEDITVSVIFAPNPVRQGNVSFTLYLAGPTKKALEDAEIYLKFGKEDADFSGISPFPANQAGEGSLFYTANDYADSPGVWKLDVDVKKSNFGSAHLEYRIMVEPSS